MNEQSIQALKNALQADLTDYRGVPFWSWNNELDEKELVRQIEDMKAAGLGGFIMHARIGLKTEYLGEKWFSCIDACLKKAKELHMNAWVYDENGWPSGFVGGKLLENPDYLARFLTYEVKDDFDSTAFCVFEKTDAGYTRLYASKEGTVQYHCIYLQVSPANTDILNPVVVDAFIKETHEQYYARFAESFGKELVGFFTDEPQYYRWATPYTPVAEALFESRYGEDIRNGLIYLFVQDENGYVFRLRYYQMLNELYTNNFYKKLYDWCEAHNCKLTGHSIEERTLVGQMLGGAGVMPSYRYEHIPAIDCLGRNCMNELATRQLASVASQMGIHQTMTETFACCGHDVTPKELKSVGDSQFFNGVSLLCHHLYPYSLAAQGKTDHPPVFSPQGNWFSGFGDFNEYFTRLGYLVANTTDCYDVLIVHPMRDVYLDYLHKDPQGSTKQINESFNELLLTLRRHGVCYHLADEGMLQDMGRVEDGALVIGNCRYQTVLVPQMRNISSPTLALLEQFGGKLCMLGTPELIDGVPQTVRLTPNYTFDALLQNVRTQFFCEDGRCGLSARQSDLGDYLFIKNYSRTKSSRVVMRDVAEHYRLLDLETLTLSDISNDVTLEACGGLILVRDENARVAEPPVTVREDITEAFRVTDVTENHLVLDYISISYDGENFGERLPVQRQFEDLLRADYKGPLWLCYRFNVADKMPLTALLEREKYQTVRLNGKDLTLCDTDFDINFVTADLSDAVQCGENKLVVSLDYYQHDGVHFALFDPMATESLRNCLYYDTHIENAFVIGDFVLDAQHTVHRRTALPALSSQNHQNGYPFFAGKLTLCGSYAYNGIGKRTLSLEKGRFIQAELCINGKTVLLTMDSKRDVTSLLKTGDNQISIVLHASLRNLFGPHHWAPDPEPIGVSPLPFTLRGLWNGGMTPKYTPVYNTVPFGVDAVEMIVG